MELIYGSEFSFVDGYSMKPYRTFVVNTNAPLHSSGFEVPPSGGIATFPTHSKYNDRFILWRAIGQKLYLEERSLLYSVSNGSLCIDFSRTPIIPGTSITLFDEDFISIVVPTATTIHRFFARLTSAKSNDTFSILCRIKEDDLIRRFHTAHVLTSGVRPLRASVTHHPQRNTVALSTAEGKLVVVTLNALNAECEQHEETIFGDKEFFKLFFGSSGSQSNLYSDVCVVKNGKLGDMNQKRSAFPGITSDLIFGVTRDGWVQAWNVETKKQLPSTLHLKNVPRDGPTDDQDLNGIETSYIIRAYPVDKDVLLVIGCDAMKDGKTISTCVHLVKATTDKLTHIAVYEKNLSTDEKLIDVAIVQLDSPGDEPIDSDDDSLPNSSIPSSAVSYNLTVMFKSSSIKKKYLLRRISLSIDWNPGSAYLQCGWHYLKQFSSHSTSFIDISNGGLSSQKNGEMDEEITNKPYDLSADSSVESLMDVVFDTDLHSFDVVYRAVQIVTDNYRGGGNQIRYNQWLDVMKLIDSYLTSVEFNRKFHMKTERSIRLRLNAANETQIIAKKAFWWALLRACEELDFASRGAISLAPLQMGIDVKLMIVIHKDRMTLLGDNDLELFEIACSEKSIRPLSSENPKTPNEELVDLIEKAATIAEHRIHLMNRDKTRSANARNGTTQSDEEHFENGYDYEIDGQNLSINPILDSRILKLSFSFMTSANYDNSRAFGSPSRRVFGGSFTQSLIAANIRVAVERRLHFALTMRALLNGIAKQRSKSGSSVFGEIDSLQIELREIIRIYRELIEQLDLKVVKNGARMSLCTWLTIDDEGLEMIRTEGGYGDDGSLIEVGDFNVFVGNTTEAAVRALLSTSEVLVLFRRLVAKHEYKTLLIILNSYINETNALKPVINFYKGIAYSGTDHPVKALSAFMSTLDAFNDGNVALRKTILHLLPRSLNTIPGTDPIDQLETSEFYLTLLKFLQEHNHTEEVVPVAMKCIQSLSPDNESVKRISNTLYNLLVIKNEWYKALKLVLNGDPNTSRRRAAICDLLTQMLAKGEWEAIATMAYGVHEQVVEDFLREAASKQSPSDKQHKYELLFAYFVARKDYRMAASSMYEYARHIESTSQMTAELLKKRRDALAAVLNMQAILSIDEEDEDMAYDDHEDTNLVFPAASDDEDDEDFENGESDSSPENRGFSTVPQGPRRFGTVLKDSTRQEAGFNSNNNPNGNGSTGNNSSVFTSSNSNNSYSISTSSGENDENKKKELKTRRNESLDEDIYRQTQDLQKVLEKKEPVIGLPQTSSGPIDIDMDEENDENMENEIDENDDSDETKVLEMGPMKKRKRVMLMTENQIRDEWIVCAARVGLLSSELYDGIPPTDPKELMKALTDTLQFDTAFDVARQFSLDTERLFFSLVREAIMIDALKDDLNIEAAAAQWGGWVRNNRRHCLNVATSEDHWAVVRGLVDAANVEWPHDLRCLRGAVEAFSSHRVNIPFWLHNAYETHDANDYLRCLIDYENYSTALQVVIDLVDKESVKVAIAGTKTWLPYGAIDELMKLSGVYANTSDGRSPSEQVIATEVSKLRKHADEKLVTYFKKLESFEKAHQMSTKFL